MGSTCVLLSLRKAKILNTNDLFELFTIVGMNYYAPAVTLFYYTNTYMHIYIYIFCYRLIDSACNN